MDTLSAALNSLHVTGAIFTNAVCTAPWGYAVPPMRSVSHILAPGTERVVGYHFVVEGRALVQMADVADVPLSAGDLLIIPHGTPHVMKNGSPKALADSGAFIDDFVVGQLNSTRMDGGGETTRFVCGYFGCERHADRLFLAGLPPIIRINVRSDPSSEWLEQSIRHLVSEAAGMGHSALLSKMAEALFVAGLRRYMQQLPPEQTGWLAGACDPVVGAALALLHRKPSYPWTMSDLAVAVGASRSVLAERFTRLLGEAPLRYLARWRLQLAQRLMQTTRKTVLQVALDVGYEDEAAFIRAFKREFGLPPGRYRTANSIAAAAVTRPKRNA